MASWRRLAGRFAALLEDRGIGMGDRVVLWGENSAEWVAAFYGCMLRGVMAVPLDCIRKCGIRSARCGRREAEVGGRGCHFAA